MGFWLDEYPVLRTMQKSIAAQDYNRIRLAMLRQQLPWHVPLSGFRSLLGILDESAWICVDECQNNLPILAWTDFNTSRSALHTPVQCELRLYHMKAGLVMGTVLDALTQAATEHGKSPSRGRNPVAALDP